MASIEFKLPPLADRLVPFCSMDEPDGKDFEAVMAQMKEWCAEMVILHQFYIDTIEMERESIVGANELKLGRVEFLPSTVIWAREKYRRTFRKYHEARHAKAMAKHEDVVQFLAFLKRCVEVNLPIIVDWQAFVASVSLSEDPELARYERRITSLVSYIHHGIERAKKEMVTTQKLVKTLKETVGQVDLTTEYAPMNKFDEMFMDFAVQSKLIGKFEQLIAAMPSVGGAKKVEKRKRASVDIAPATPVEKNSPVVTPFSFIDNSVLITEEPSLEIEDHDDPFEDVSKAVDFRDFDLFAQFFFLSLGGGPTNDKREFIVMRCAAIRVLFDWHYIKNEAVLSGFPCSPSFLKRSQETLARTPRDLCISKLIIGEPVASMQMKDIVLGNAHLTNCLHHCALVPFFVNPMDMAYHFFLGMREVEQAATIFAMGQLGEKVHSLTFELGYDDLFSIFMSVFALLPIPNPLALRSFLDLFKNLVLPQPLDYALVSAKAAIDHLNEQP